MRKILGAALLIGALLLPVPAIAQTSGLRLSPSKTVVTAAPGETVGVPIALQNSTNKPLTIQVSAKDFTASPEMNGEPQLLDEPNHTYGLANWLKDSNIQKMLTVPAKQTITYQAQFLVPTTAREQTYFGSVIFSYVDSGRQISMSTLVFITVGNPSVQLSVDTINWEESENASDTHGVITATIHNEGYGLADPKFRLRITGGSGKLLEEITDDSAGSVLPRSSRKYSFALTKPLPNEHITFTLSVTDQHGNTTDKATQLDRRKDSLSATRQPEEPRSLNRVLLPLLEALLVVLLGASGALLFRKKAIMSKQVATDQDKESPSADLSIQSTDEVDSNH